MRILIIKTSSLGDVIHTLPALMDAKRAYPNAQFDWLIEESFAEIPLSHPAIHQVHTLTWRTWVKARQITAIFKFFAQLRKLPRYDLIIDAQGLLKSALMARCVSGVRHGLDRQSLREPLARFFYQVQHSAPKNQHAVERTRQLFARALNYPYHAHTPVEYGYSERLD